MNDTTLPTGALREQADALRLHGLLAHWSEVMSVPEQARQVAQWLAWESEECCRRKPGAAPARGAHRALQAAGRLRLGLAQAVRPRGHRGADDARLPRRREQRKRSANPS